MTKPLFQRAKRLLALSVLIASLPACATSPTAAAPAPCMQAFTYDGAPVSTEVVAAFEPYISDRTSPIITAMNLSATHASNQFAAESLAGADARLGRA